MNTLAARIADFEHKYYYDHGHAVFLGTLVTMAAQVHPGNPLDVNQAMRVAPDWRMLTPQAYVQAPADKNTSPLRPGYEWAYPF